MNSGESKILTWTPKYIKATAPKSCPINFVIGFRCTKSSTRPKTLIIKPKKISDYAYLDLRYKNQIVVKEKHS